MRPVPLLELLRAVPQAYPGCSAAPTPAPAHTCSCPQPSGAAGRGPELGTMNKSHATCFYSLLATYLGTGLSPLSKVSPLHEDVGLGLIWRRMTCPWSLALISARKLGRGWTQLSPHQAGLLPTAVVGRSTGSVGPFQPPVPPAHLERDRHRGDSRTRGTAPLGQHFFVGLSDHAGKAGT